MRNRDTSCCLAYTGVAVWIVHRIFDVTIFHKITNFTDCHFRTVVLRLLCGSTKMRCYGCIWQLYCCRIWKINNVFCYFTGLQCHFDVVFVHQCITGEVKKNNTVFHLVKCLFVKHSLGGIQKRNMHGKVITHLIQFLICFYHRYIAGHVKCMLNGQIRVTSVNIHTETVCRIGN